MSALNRLRYNLRQTQKIAGKAHDNAEHTLFPGDQIRQDIAFMRQLLDRAERHLDTLTGRKGESR